MTQFAEATDLALFLNRDATEQENQRADFMLRLASAAVQSYTHQTIALVVDDQIELPGTYDEFVQLPQRPVVDVTGVSVRYPGGTVLTTPSNAFASDRMGRLFYSASALANGPDEEEVGVFGGPNSTLVVVYSHGFDPIPDDIALATLMIAGRMFVNPQFPSGLDSETIGDYTYISRKAREIALTLFREESSLLDQYRLDSVGSTSI